MNFSTAVKTCLRKYADFKGRASRSEYWWFALAQIILVFVVTFIGGLISETVGKGLGTIVLLALLLPGLAVGVRRLHDTGKSGWLLLISLIPLVGLVVLLYFLVQRSQPQSNEYGETPTTV